MRAYDCHHRDRCIPDAIVMAVLWPQTPHDWPKNREPTESFYAIPREQRGAHESLWLSHGATYREASDKEISGAWVGIKLCASNGVAAWGHAIIEGVAP